MGVVRMTPPSPRPIAGVADPSHGRRPAPDHTGAGAGAGAGADADAGEGAGVGGGGELDVRIGTDPHYARRWIRLAALAFLLSALLLPFVGPSSLDLRRVWAREDPDWSILVQLRLSRTLLGLFGGGALALGGSLFQAMLRDALATPYTLGVSTGASLGAVVAIALGWHTVAGMPGVWAGAFAGAAAVLLAIVWAATSGTGGPSRGRQVSAFGLLLAGIATNSVCSALILLIHGLSGMSQSFAISRWLIGSLDAVDPWPLVLYIAVISALAVIVIRRARAWNLLAVGDAWAATRGASVSRLLFIGYAAGSVLAATTVALTGPIGFIGLVVPHLVRARVSADDRILMPCAFLFGGVLLAACDAFGRIVLAPAEVPAGAITACIGGPYLVWLVRRRV
jgi:iron complex transport system permease protein